MADTYFGSTIKAGTSPSQIATGTGTALLAQTVTLQAATATTVDGTITLPTGGRIVNIHVDSTVAWTAATAGLTIGTASLGTQYVSSMDVKTITRGPTAAYTAAQLAAFNYGTTTTLVASVASGTPNATGTTVVTVLYTMG